MVLNFLKPLIKPIAEKVAGLIPEPNKRKEAAENLEKEIFEAVMTAQNAQAQINLAEAKHKSIFVAGWRPFIGWICGIAIMWTYLIHPIATWVLLITGVQIAKIPTLNMNALMPLIMGMLGMGAIRSYEKIKGVARNT